LGWKNKSQKSELVKQAAIELLENWKPHLFTINKKKFAMHQEIATVLEVDFILQLQSVENK
jgi:hypothetical protein